LAQIREWLVVGEIHVKHPRVQAISQFAEDCSKTIEFLRTQAGKKNIASASRRRRCTGARPNRNSRYLFGLGAGN
jgi:hypothetical protein